MNMASNNLKEILKFLNTLLNDEKYDEDKDLIKKTNDEINNLLIDKNYINDTTLEVIKYNINYLDRKYDYLYDPVYIGYKKIITKY